MWVLLHFLLVRNTSIGAPISQVNLARNRGPGSRAAPQHKAESEVYHSLGINSCLPQFQVRSQLPWTATNSSIISSRCTNEPCASCVASRLPNQNGHAARANSLLATWPGTSPPPSDMSSPNAPAGVPAATKAVDANLPMASKM